MVFRKLGEQDFDIQASLSNYYEFPGWVLLALEGLISAGFDEVCR
ncbi:MAG: hypothetical protein V3W45_02600 [Sedimentisphaerales bacterium]